MRESKRNKQRSRMKLDEREKTVLQAREEDKLSGGLEKRRKEKFRSKRERERVAWIEMDNRERRAEERAQLLLYLQFPEALSTRTT